MKNSISKLILGTVQFGLDYGINNPTGKVSQDQIVEILKSCKQNSITKLDTSFAYGNSEQVIGAFADKSFDIITKLPHTNEKVADIFQRSLSQLKRDKVYAYLVHHFDFFVEKPSIWNDILQLKQAKLIEKTGFSLYEPKELEYILNKEIEFDIIQVPYNIFDRSFDPYFKDLQQRKIEIHIRSVFLQGLFFKSINTLPEKLKPLREYLQKLHSFCQENHISIEELALNFVIHNSDIDGVIIGVDHVDQLKRNIHSVWNEWPEKMNNFVDSFYVKETELLKPKNWN